MFLDCICGSTTGGLGLLGLYINESNVALVNQTLETLTEYCQGPCHDNQVNNNKKTVLTEKKKMYYIVLVYSLSALPIKVFLEV